MKRRNLFGCKISKELKIDEHMLYPIHEDYYILLIAQQKNNIDNANKMASNTYEQ